MRSPETLVSLRHGPPRRDGRWLEGVFHRSRSILFFIALGNQVGSEQPDVHHVVAPSVQLPRSHLTDSPQVL